MSNHLPDRRVPGYLGRVLDANAIPAGTCFQVMPGVLVTAWHVLHDIGTVEVGTQVAVDPLRGGNALSARVARVDGTHDLAILIADRPLPMTAGMLAETDRVPLATEVAVTGYAQVDDATGHTYRFLEAIGEWAGGTTRNDSIRLGCMISNRILPGMSGAPVIDNDDVIIGMVSGRYNSTDGWLAGNIWVVRTEDLTPLLIGLTDLSVRLQSGTGVSSGIAQQSDKSSHPSQNFAAKPAIRWAHGGIPADHFAGRMDELARLGRWVHDADVNVIGVTAWGGAGKTALVTELILRHDVLSARTFRGLFAWSFYEDPVVESWARTLLSWANATFDVRPQTSPLPVQVLELVKELPLMLVLDGLEVLQESPAHHEFGRLLDGALRAVLVGICLMDTNSLAILTSRFPFADLEHFDGTAARMLEVPPLTPTEGAHLLKEGGASWLSTQQRLDLVALVDGHALAVSVLTALLRDRMPTADLEGLLSELRSASRTDARVAKVLNFYANRLNEADRALISIVSLFQQPVETRAILSLGAHDYLGHALDGWSPGDVEIACRQRLTGLVTWHSEGLVSAHPLVRDVFRSFILSEKTAQLATEITLGSIPTGTVSSAPEAHRLVEVIELLLDSGQWTSARALYTGRTRNGRSWMRIPAARLGQRCAEAFLQSQLRDTWLSEQDISFFSNEAGLFAMHAGDLRRAERHLRDAAERYRSLGAFDAEAVTLRNLARCLAYHSSVVEAKEVASKALRAALEIGNIERIRNARTCLAWILDLNGETANASAQFDIANKTQASLDGRDLYSVDGTWWADLLLRTDQLALARDLTVKNLHICEAQGWNADVGRCHRLLGKCDIAGGEPEEAGRHLEMAISIFRDGDYLIELADALCEMGECHRRRMEFSDGERVCTEAVITLASPRELIPSLARALSIRGRIRVDRYRTAGDSLDRERALDDADHCLRLATKISHLPWLELAALEIYSDLERYSGTSETWGAHVDALRSRLHAKDSGSTEDALIWSQDSPTALPGDKRTAQKGVASGSRTRNRSRVFKMHGSGPRSWFSKDSSE